MVVHNCQSRMWEAEVEELSCVWASLGYKVTSMSAQARGKPSQKWAGVRRKRKIKKREKPFDSSSLQGLLF